MQNILSPFLVFKNPSWAGRVAQVVECLPGKQWIQTPVLPKINKYPSLLSVVVLHTYKSSTLEIEAGVFWILGMIKPYLKK
jgi:hypothetical protein